MRLAVNLKSEQRTGFHNAVAAETVSREAIELAIQGACNKIAPVWPLKNFVAVNPFLGFSGQTFAATCATMRRVTQVDMLMPRSFYLEKIAAGYIEDQDLAAALAETPNAEQWFANVAALKTALAKKVDNTKPRTAVVATIADLLDGMATTGRQAPRTAFMVDEISKWCAAYFEDVQASWRLPFRDLPPYAAWRASIRYDLNPEMMGIKNFRKSIAELPESPIESIAHVINALSIPQRAVEDYLYRALFDINGWAAYARYLVWDNELYGRKDDTLIQLLAIRVAWGYGLYLEHDDPSFKAAWQEAMASAAVLPDDDRLGNDIDLTINLTLQNAYESAYQRQLLSLLAQQKRKSAANPPLKPFHAAFCIDVRSEIFRRALETVCPEVKTIGFAGFFGYPIEYIPIGRLKGGAQCPVLLKPAFVVCEAVKKTSDEEETEILGLRLLRRRAAKAWKSFKVSAVSTFIFVETVGLTFAGKLLSDTLRLTRPVSDPNTDGLDNDIITRVGPRLAARTVGDRQTGFTDEQSITMAEAVCRAMSMTEAFGRLVMLVGHGSTTVNNPHASSLDCGACGGHTGEANARVAAGIMNDPKVRAKLKERGIVVPDDSYFLACLHDTTTDEIKIYDVDEVPATHTEDLKQLRVSLEKATALTRMERAPQLGISDQSKVDEEIINRSRDWSQVRPEWALAGNAAFIAASRRHTKDINLGGRAFLHSYHWWKDQDFKVLELIMTAPMIVASWINLQYYGSTVNNRAFGSGNKTLHNVVGTIGVLEGNAGDLKVGLPWQSVHDGKRFVHEPLRLNVFIEAPIDAINNVIAKHEDVRNLTDNGWIHLFAIAETGVSHRYRKNLQWEGV